MPRGRGIDGRLTLGYEKSMATEFTTHVLKMIKGIPKGKVATYSQIAALAGSPHAARGVVWILTTSSTRHRLPWHRVISARGQIAFDSSSVYFTRQKSRLRREGVESDQKGRIDLKRYLWSKKPARPKTKKKATRGKARQQPTMFS